jgi:hypothetical protein
LCHPLLQDIYTLFHLHRDFKFISKTSNFLIPIIGWSMFLTGEAGDLVLIGLSVDRQGLVLIGLVVDR